MSPPGERTERKDIKSGEGAQKHSLGAVPGHGDCTLLGDGSKPWTWASPAIIPPPPELGLKGLAPKHFIFISPLLFILGDARSRWGGVKGTTFLLSYSISSSISVRTAGKGLAQGGNAPSKLGPGKLEDPTWLPTLG